MLNYFYCSLTQFSLHSPTIIFLVSFTNFLPFISKHGIDLTDMHLHLCGHPLAFFGKQFLDFLPVSIIDKKYGKIFNQLFSLRLTGDYEDRHILNMETEVLPLVEPAKELIDLVSEMAKKQLM